MKEPELTKMNYLHKLNETVNFLKIIQDIKRRALID